MTRSRSHKKRATISTRRSKPLNYYILEWVSSNASKEFCDVVLRCIVRARTSANARKIAQENAQCEAELDNTYTQVAFWTDPKRTTCRLLSTVYKNRQNEELLIQEGRDCRRSPLFVIPSLYYMLDVTIMCAR